MVEYFLIYFMSMLGIVLYLMVVLATRESYRALFRIMKLCPNNERLSKRAEIVCIDAGLLWPFTAILGMVGWAIHTLIYD